MEYLDENESQKQNREGLTANKQSGSKQIEGKDQRPQSDSCLHNDSPPMVEGGIGPQENTSYQVSGTYRDIGDEAYKYTLNPYQHN